MFNFKDKLVFVTGGSSGIGLSICEEMARNGAKVVVGYSRNDISGIEKKFSELGLTVYFQKIEVSSSESVRDAADSIKNRHGLVDFLVTSAGIAPMQEVLTYDDDIWRKTQAVNLDGTFFCTREFGKQMKEKGGGAIVFISSIAAHRVVRPETHASYGASKAAISHLVSLVANELTTHNIRVNCVSPGYVNTDILKTVGSENPKILQEWLSLNPMHRLIEPVEVSNAVMFLLSDLASAITGTDLLVDAGYTIW